MEVLNIGGWGLFPGPCVQDEYVAWKPQDPRPIWRMATCSSAEGACLTHDASEGLAIFASSCVVSETPHCSVRMELQVLMFVR